MSKKKIASGERLPRHRTSTTVIALGLPALFLLSAIAVINSWRDELPDPVAQNWGIDGPDTFGSLNPHITFMVIFVSLICLMFWGLALFMRAGRRVLVGSSAGIAAMVCMLTVGSLDIQRGLSDAAEATDISGPLAISFISGLGVGFAAAYFVPADPPLPTTAPLPRGASVAKVRKGSKPVWIGTTFSKVGTILGAAVVVSTAVLALALSQPAMLLVSLVTAFALGSTTYFHVTVNERGLSVRSALGWPRLQIPLDEILSASTTTISPFQEFGGWGWRVGHRAGAIGIVTFKGEALEVERTGERVAVVTINGAKKAAAVLNALISEQRGTQ